MATKTKKKAKTRAVRLLIGTRKGLFFLRSDKERKEWKLKGPEFLGHVIQHVVLDPRDKRAMVVAAATGHLGPTTFRSTDGGKTFVEASRPPAFDAPKNGRRARSVERCMWLTPGHDSEPGVWYVGTVPQGLFRSEDGGDTWAPVQGFNEHPMVDEWSGDPKNSPPGMGASLHSIRIDPEDKRHMIFGMSPGGVFESIDGGADWKPLNRGVAADFLPGEEREYGHDPHNVALHPERPSRLWMQNHCGIYRMDRGDGVWVRVGDNMPKKIGDIGFPIVMHPTDPDTAWVFPMDGTDVWPRTSPGGRPAVYRTRDAGETWERQDKGFPDRQAWFTVKRQCMAHDGLGALGLYLGTTQGEVWASRNGGRSWKCLVRHLPEIFSIEVSGLVS